MAQTQFTSKAHIEGLVRGWIDKLAWQHEIRRAETGGFDFLTSEEIDTLGTEDSRELEALLRFTGRMHDEDEKKDIARVLRGERDLGKLEPIVQSAARTINAPADFSTLDGRLLTFTILRGYATFLDEIRETVAAIPRQIASPAPKPTPIPDIEFLQFWDDFKAHKVGNRDWKGDTAANARGTRNVFDKLFPGATVEDLVSKPVASDLKTKLLALPQKYSRGKWGSMSADKIMKEAAKEKNIPMMQPNTVNKHYGNLAGYWDYLVEKKHICAEIKNPFVGYFTPGKKGKAARQERNNWPKTLEAKFFSSPVFRGSSSIFRRSRPGKEIHRDAMLWVPLWGRLTGVRQNEICDALVGAIKQIETDEGNIPYLEIINGKDSGSERDVPVPDLILDAGFMEHRVIGRDPNAPLFPELIAQGPGERRSAAFSGKFTYIRQTTGCYMAKVDFHSMRGNVETDLKNTSGINSAWIDELIGHESIIRRSEGERYTKAILLPILRRCVNLIKINADLTHLNYTGPRNTAAPGRDREIARFVAVAEREMRKKTSRKRKKTSD